MSSKLLGAFEAIDDCLNGDDYLTGLILRHTDYNYSDIDNNTLNKYIKRVNLDW